MVIVVVMIVLQRLYQRVGGNVRVSLLVFQQFLLLLVQSVFDEEYLRHFDVVVGSHEYAFNGRDEKNCKKNCLSAKKIDFFVRECGVHECHCQPRR